MYNTWFYLSNSIPEKINEWYIADYKEWTSTCCLSVNNCRHTFDHLLVTCCTIHNKIQNINTIQIQNKSGDYEIVTFPPTRVHNSCLICEINKVDLHLNFFIWFSIVVFVLAGILLGQGAFGKVVKAEAIGILDNPETTIVAVKMPRGLIFFHEPII